MLLYSKGFTTKGYSLFHQPMTQALQWRNIFFPPLTAILLAHLKLSHDEIYNCMMINAPDHVRRRLDASHYKQLLLYAPSEDESAKLRSFDGDISGLNDVDQLGHKVGFSRMKKSNQNIFKRLLFKLILWRLLPLNLYQENKFEGCIYL